VTLDPVDLDPVDLDRAYEQCRRINAAHGRTYYLATLLLPVHKRPAVHALYALARYADDIVDVPAGSLAEVRSRLDALAAALMSAEDQPPFLAAVHDTVRRWEIPLDLFEAFFASMRMDLHVHEYATWEDLSVYMHGSAAVIGLQMLPILEPVPGLAEVAAPYAVDLGRAFQLTNFIRDVGEDLRRGRLYLPKEDLAAFTVSRDDLECGVLDSSARRLLAFEVARARQLFHEAELGIRLLHPTSRDCIRTALALYRGILDEVEASNYSVLDRRARVSSVRRASVAVPALARAWWSRRPHHTHQARVWSTRANPKPRSSTGAYATRHPTIASGE
jgi:phytoene synthase